eukprot:COSAG01_NODE_516_length_16026_cov_63.502857_8_plen_94_part_00
MCGLPFIDVDDWSQHTDYIGSFKQLKENHPTVEKFWEVVRGWPLDMQAGLLRFTTGTPKVPVRATGCGVFLYAGLRSQERREVGGAGIARRAD